MEEILKGKNYPICMHMWILIASWNLKFKMPFIDYNELILEFSSSGKLSIYFFLQWLNWLDEKPENKDYVYMYRSGFSDVNIPRLFL